MNGTENANNPGPSNVREETVNNNDNLDLDSFNFDFDYVNSAGDLSSVSSDPGNDSEIDDLLELFTVESDTVVNNDDNDPEDHDDEDIDDSQPLNIADGEDDSDDGPDAEALARADSEIPNPTPADCIDCLVQFLNFLVCAQHRNEFVAFSFQYMPGLAGEDAVISAFMQIGPSTNTSHSAQAQYLQWAVDNCEEIKIRKDSGLIRCHRQYRRYASRNLPTFLYDYFIKAEDGNVESFRKKEVIKEYPTMDKLYEMGYIDMTTLVVYHRNIHHGVMPDNGGPETDFKIPVHLFVDNIQESKSSTRSVCVYAIKFQHCALTYPVVIVRPIMTKAINYRDILKKLLEKIEAAGIRVVHVVADAPKRGELRCVKQHGAYFGCDYCKGKAERVTDPEGNSRTKVWAVKDAELRTKEWMLDVIENWSDLTEDEQAGVKDIKSVLFDIPSFDPIQGMPPEYMHSMCLGVVNLLSELTLDVTNSNRSGNASLKRIPMADFAKSIKNIKVPREFSRRVRQMDSNWKAEDYRNLILFFFPAVIHLTKFAPRGTGSSAGQATRMIATNTKTSKSERRTMKQKVDDQSESKILAAHKLNRLMWNTMAFLLRLYTLPDEEYHLARLHIRTKFLIGKQNQFVDLLIKVHGRWNCPYNAHQVTHLHIMRERGPFWYTSAFYGECMFSKLQRVAKPNTRNPIKVQFESVYTSWKTGHACQRSITIAPESKKKTVTADDSLFYTLRNDKYNFYKTCDRDGYSVKAHRIALGNGPNIDPTYYDFFPWYRVGVFTFVRVRDEEDPVTIHRSEIAGKAIIVHDLIMTVANGLLRETSTT